MDKSDFKVMLRRVPGYEPSVSIRFEMSEGFGELLVGDKRHASPSAIGEVTEVTGEVLRAGRFVHVLSSGRRRQSYALSRIDDERLQRLSDDRWTELSPLTEFGIRYLELPALEPAPSVAVVQVAAAEDRPRVAAAPRVTASLSPGAGTATRGSVSPPSSRTKAPRPAPAASLSPTRTAPPPAAPRHASQNGAPPRIASPTAAPIPVEAELGRAAVQRLSADEARIRLLGEMAKVADLLDRVKQAEEALAASQARERDLLEVLARWQKRG